MQSSGGTGQTWGSDGAGDMDCTKGTVTGARRGGLGKAFQSRSGLDVDLEVWRWCCRGKGCRTAFQKGQGRRGSGVKGQRSRVGGTLSVSGEAEGSRLGQGGGRPRAGG